MLKFHKFPLLNYEEISTCQPLVLLESNKFHDGNDKSYLFLNPLEIITAYNFSEVEQAFARIENQSHHFFLAGYFAYELGAYWERPELLRTNLQMPLIWLGVFNEENVYIFDHLKNEFNQPLEYLADTALSVAFNINNAKINISRDAYFDKIAAIKRYIEAGDTYQVNFTTDFCFDFSGNPYAFYQNLKSKQPVDYNAFIRHGDATIISISPELYFKREGQQITTRPMKGTMRRGRYAAEDTHYVEALKNDAKNRSENIMIVDLMRNDLGRISEVGSVRVENQFKVEKYPSLFQMTSTVKSRLKAGVGCSDIFGHLFPSGSVTGAPKIRTMEIIHELEQAPRGVYTGAIGFIAPYEQAVFNVPIRTITIKGNAGRMGVGSGIVYDSNPESEYDECLLKANFLVEEFHEFSLIETMLWNGGIVLLPVHLERLQGSAGYFGFPFDRFLVEKKVTEAEHGLLPKKKYKLRLLLNREGDVEIIASEIELNDLQRPTVRISSKRVSSRNRFLYHKTTRRDFYTREFSACRTDGFYDVIFMNEMDEITEGAISNIFIKKGEVFFTPPIACGLLNGVFRQDFMNKNANVVEKKLYLNDLHEADEIYLTNAVRGMVRVWLDDGN